MDSDQYDAVPPADTNVVDSNSTDSESMNPLPSSQTSKVRALPWIIMWVALYVFTLPWINFAIIQRYFVNPDWELALPGLDSTTSQKWTMRGHMAAGAVCLVLGPLQFVPRVRKSYPIIHRWSGRIYCICAMMSSIFGSTFIALKGGLLVGGLNMSIAFATAGVTNGVLAFKAWQAARAAKSGTIPDFTFHRNWGIRSYSQILAPVLYRYWYIALQIFNIYNGPPLYSMGLECDAEGVCFDYLRWLDMVHCWTYWLTALGIAELIIYCLPRDKDFAVEAVATEVIESGGHSTVSMLLADGSPSSYTDDEDPQPIKNPPPIRTKSMIAINSIGWVLAAITAVVTTKLFTYQGPHG